MTTFSNAAPFAVPAGLVDALAAAYAQPPRVYHNIEHVHEVLAHYADVAGGPGWSRPREVFLAVLYHDAIYESGKRDNEARSARFAQDEIARHLPDAGIDAARVADLIELTARHGRVKPGEVDADAALFLDCDMAILAAAPERFDAYDKQIAQEYRGTMPAWLFRHYRRKFLKGLLGAPRIYLSEFFHTRCDAAARANLSRVLKAPRSTLAASAGR